MSNKEQIGRLSHLLHRVQIRAQEPRASRAPYAPEPVVMAQALMPSAPPPRVVTPTPEPVEVEHDSLPPQTIQVASAEVSVGEAYLASSEDDFDADVEVSSETVEVDIDIDEPMPMESGAQPVAQQTMPPEELEELEEVNEPVMAAPTSVRPPEPVEEEMTLTAPANEVEEPAPSSSRRPIAGEEPAETYGEESAPRHTPPPESGKQVAAPSVHPVAARSAEPSVLPSAPPPSLSPSGPSPSMNPSAPPPSMEGHTLVGGWREPGLGAPQIGVPQISPAASTGRIAAVEPPAPPQASGTRLTADVTRPELAASANVARFEGPAPVARPATLGELLDMTLAL